MRSFSAYTSPPVIYLSDTLLRRYIAPRDEVAAYPPARTSSPQTPVYLTLQLTGDAARGVAIAPGGLLPHLFTLTARIGGGCFLSPCPTVTHGFPLGNVMLYVARTFLLTDLSVHAKRQATPLPIVFRTAKLQNIFEPAINPNFAE